MCCIGLILIAIDGWSRDLTNAYVVGTALGLVVSFLILILHITKAGRPLQGFLSFQIYFNVALFIYLLVVSAVILSEQYNNRYMAGGVINYYYYRKCVLIFIKCFSEFWNNCLFAVFG